ncbi:MAG: precorrin-8X methylmutase [Proteobacteria bacterium]|nr:MAG: precorrin-8X methylmutase [Pseudomonadota bacterium]
MIKYERDPKLIRKTSIAAIRDTLNLNSPDSPEQQLLIHMILAYGDEAIASDTLISESAIKSGLCALKKNANILCDSKMVAEGLKQSDLKKEPICLTDKPSVISQAKSKKLTRAMVAVENWKRFAEGSIVLIGNEATALLRLMELIETGDIDKPALIIGMPQGYFGATEAKQYLWENHQQFDIPCITIQGTTGGSTLTAAAMNNLIQLDKGIFL